MEEGDCSEHIHCVYLYKENGICYVMALQVLCFLHLLSNSYIGGCHIRLFFMLRRFPIESKGRRKKLREVCSILIYISMCPILFMPGLGT